MPFLHVKLDKDKQYNLHSHLSNYERDDHRHEELREDGGERDRRRGAQLHTHTVKNILQYYQKQTLDNQ